MGDLTISYLVHYFVYLSNFLTTIFCSRVVFINTKPVREGLLSSCYMFCPILDLGERSEGGIKPVKGPVHVLTVHHLNIAITIKHTYERHNKIKLWAFDIPDNPKWIYPDNKIYGFSQTIEKIKLGRIRIPSA